MRSPAHLLERISLIMVVGGVLFEFATGIMDIQNFYAFPFSFYTAHLYGAWVFIAGLVIHVSSSSRGCWPDCAPAACAGSCACRWPRTQPEDPDPAACERPGPRRRPISRRGLLAAVGGGSVLLAALMVGQSIGGWTRRTALFAPRGLSATGPGSSR